MRGELIGFGFAFAGMVLLSCNYITAKTAMEAFSPLTFSVLWYWVASFYSLLLVVMLGQTRSLLASRRELLVMATLGLALTTSASVGWAALKIMDPTFNAFLGRITPMNTILLGALLLKERVRPLEWLAVAVMIAGGALSTLGGTWRLEWLGITLTLIASFFTALQFTLGQIGRSELPPVVQNLFRTTVAATIFTVWCLVFGGFEISGAQPRHWTAIGLGALFGPCLSVSLLYKSYRYWNVTRTGMVLTLQPLVVLPMAYGMFGSIPHGWKLIGGLIIVGGGLWLVTLHRPATAERKLSTQPDGTPLPLESAAPGTRADR